MNRITAARRWVWHVLTAGRFEPFDPLEPVRQLQRTGTLMDANGCRTVPHAQRASDAWNTRTVRMLRDVSEANVARAPQHVRRLTVVRDLKRTG